MRKYRLKLIKIKIVSFFSEDHNDILDHKYHINPGNLFSIQYNLSFLNFKEAL